jgi:hypothetical protein
MYRVGDESSITWIADGEKYGLVGLTIKLEGQLPAGKISPNLWVLTDAKFNVPPSWRDWLGSIRVEEVEDCNLFLLSKVVSAAPGVLDAESKTVQQRAWSFYVGLLLASTFSPAHRPVLLTGSRRDGEIDIRQQQDLDSPIPGVVRPYPSVVPDDVRRAAHLGENLETLATAPISGGHWRLFRTLHVYTEARTTGEIVDRIHQYCRCIDGLILPAVGKTRQQFKSRTEIFIGPGHHDLMGELYDVRSAVEHLHENRYLESFDRATRLDLAKKEAIIEHIARTALARVIGDDTLWPHFANTPALEKFWGLTPPERTRIWGDPVDPLTAIADFDPQYIHDDLLGR